MLSFHAALIGLTFGFSIQTAQAYAPEENDIVSNDFDDYTLTIRYKRCADKKVDLEKEFARMANMYCADSVESCFPELGNQTWVFDTDSVYILWQPDYGDHHYSRAKDVTFENWQLLIRAKIMLIYKVPYGSNTNQTYFAIVPKHLVADMLLTNKPLLESEYGIVLLSMEPIRKRHLGWAEAWLWPLTFVVLIVCVTCLKAGFYISGKRAMYADNAVRMDKMGELKKKRKFVTAYLSDMYKAEAAEEKMKTAELKPNESRGKANGVKGTVDTLPVVDCDSVYKLDMETTTVEPDVPVTVVPKVKLPPMGSSAYHHMLTELMADPEMSKKMKAEQSATEEPAISADKPSFWHQLFCTAAKRKRPQNQPEVHQRRKPANMFSLLIGGGGNRGARKTQVLMGSKF